MGGRVLILWTYSQGVRAGDRPWRAMADRNLSRSLAGFNGDDIFHAIVNIVKNEICWGERVVQEVVEHKDHVMGKRIEEDGACFHGGDGWFP